MGVNTFLLDQRTAILGIGTTRHTVGTLRRFFKLTELDEERAAAARIRPSPVAVLIMDVDNRTFADAPDTSVPAHLVLGWDEGRGSVTDFGWDYLPQIGFAVRDRMRGHYVLHEDRAGLLHPIDDVRAGELGLLDALGKLVAREQPRITACRSVRPYIAGFAEADCIFDDGREERLLVEVTDDALPDPVCG